MFPPERIVCLTEETVETLYRREPSASPDKPGHFPVRRLARNAHGVGLSDVLSKRVLDTT
jgi:hypothetical protein